MDESDSAPHWEHVIFGGDSLFKLYSVGGWLRVRRLPRGSFKEDLYNVQEQAGGGNIHVWGHLSLGKNHSYCP